MKVIHANTYDSKGGAAKAVYRLHKGLLLAGIDSTMLVQAQAIREPEIKGPGNLVSASLYRIRPYLDYLLPYFQIRGRTTFFPALIPDNISGRIRRLDPDLVHLHWISEGFIRLESLASIPYPKIWTMNDMWAFTGGCHYAGECKRYLDHCGKCPILKSARQNDLSWRVFQRKIETYQKIRDLTITTPSHWLAGEVKRSPLMRHFEVKVIPNGLDISTFKPYHRVEAHRSFNLDPDKRYILFGAIQPSQNKLKGFDMLVAALHQLKMKDVVLLVFGERKSRITDQLPFPVRFMGWISQEEQLARLYSAADVMVVPSFQEAFGQTATEAMACGTPVVAFGTTGLLDIVIHLKTGYLARPFDPADLANGIKWVLEVPEHLLMLSENSRKRVEQQYDIRIIADQYVQLYTDIQRFSGKGYDAGLV